MSFLNERLWSNVTPRNLACLVVGIVFFVNLELRYVFLGVFVYSSSMISPVVLFSFRLLDFPQKAEIWLRDLCSLFCNVVMFLEDENVLNCEMCTVGGGLGMLAAYMMNSVELSDEPWGTPWLICMSGDYVSSIWKYVYLLQRKLLMNRRKVFGIWCWYRVWSRPLCQTLLTAFSTSTMNTDAQAWFLFFACVPICVS